MAVKRVLIDAAGVPGDQYIFLIQSDAVWTTPIVYHTDHGKTVNVRHIVVDGNRLEFWPVADGDWRLQVAVSSSLSSIDVKVQHPTGAGTLTITGKLSTTYSDKGDHVHPVAI